MSPEERTGALLYLLYTHNIPTINQSDRETFADDTVILTSSEDTTAETITQQKHIDLIEHWLKK